MPPHRPKTLGLLLATVTPFAACGPSAQPGEGERFVIAAAAFPLAEAASRVAGTAADVVSLTPPGQEPHEHELTARDVKAASTAELVVYLGGFQPAIDDLIDGGVEGVALDVVPETEVGDPHVWIAPLHMAGIVEAVEAAMAAIDPDSASVFSANADGYRRELTALDTDFAAALRTCARDTIVTEHAAFGHLASAYGFAELPIRSVEDAEPSAKQLEDVIAQASDAKATVVFSFHDEPSALVTSIADELGATIAVLDPIEKLSVDAQARGETYLTVQRANLAALTAALGCS